MSQLHCTLRVVDLRGNFVGEFVILYEVLLLLHYYFHYCVNAYMCNFYIS